MASNLKWAEQQISILVDLGIDLHDAQRSVRWVLDTLPPEGDPASWVPTSAQLWQDPADNEQDARVDWYATAPSRYKRILDARNV